MLESPFFLFCAHETNRWEGSCCATLLRWPAAAKTQDNKMFFAEGLHRAHLRIAEQCGVSPSNSEAHIAQCMEGHSIWQTVSKFLGQTSPEAVNVWLTLKTVLRSHDLLVLNPVLVTCVTFKTGKNKMLKVLKHAYYCDSSLFRMTAGSLPAQHIKEK